MLAELLAILGMQSSFTVLTSFDIHWLVTAEGWKGGGVRFGTHHIWLLFITSKLPIVTDNTSSPLQPHDTPHALS